MPAPTDPPCTRAYDEVIVLLQVGQKRQAQARAALIRCTHMRSEALKLVERSRHVCAAVRAEEWTGPDTTCCDPVPA